MMIIIKIHVNVIKIIKLIGFINSEVWLVPDNFPNTYSILYVLDWLVTSYRLLMTSMHSVYKYIRCVYIQCIYCTCTLYMYIYKDTFPVDSISVGLAQACPNNATCTCTCTKKQLLYNKSIENTKVFDRIVRVVTKGRTFTCTCKSTHHTHSPNSVH